MTPRNPNAGRKPRGIPCADEAQERERLAKNARDRRWRMAHPELVKAQQLRYTERHPERRKESYHRYNISPKGRARAERKRRPDQWRERARLYSHTPQARVMAARVKHRRRARTFALATDATLTRSQWDAIKAAYGGRCAYCGKKSKRLEKDHIRPIALGGSLAAENVVPACRSCNARKHTRLVPVQPVLVLA